MIRPAAVAGTFYPADPAELRTLLGGFFSRATPPRLRPRALVVPHAGFIYSGSVAAAAYRTLENFDRPPSRVVLLGPSHRRPVDGMALSSAAAWQRPLGQAPLDRGLVDSLEKFPAVAVNDAAHAQEHSLETQLPFLQVTLKDFAITPILVGRCDPQDVATLLQGISADQDMLLVISTDLSHYLPYDEAKTVDRETCEMVEQMKETRLGERRACGFYPLKGFLRYAREHALKATTLALSNSGDSAGGKAEVVGYGAWAFE